VLPNDGDFLYDAVAALSGLALQFLFRDRG
jgi:hypothetical protein